jgi:HK97 family phage prohead protease
VQRDVGYRPRFSAPRTRFAFTVSDRQIKCIASDATPDRYNDVLDPAGCKLANFRSNPVCLAEHDASQPLARCISIDADRDAVTATVEFPPANTSPISDQYFALIKERIISAVSVGFLPIEQKPRAGGGWLYTEWELLELSFVSVPANPSALVTERSFGNRRLARDLARARAIQRRTANVAASSEGDPLLAIRLAHARQGHERLLQRRAAVERVLMTMQW